MDNVDLSIYVTTYNHEKYIVEALDSIFAQETNYIYEILVGEDFSTDNTRKVLLDYEKKHKEKLKIFYREHNMNKELPGNGDDLRNRCKGRYVIALEGDDFWLAKNKLNTQIKFLDEHPEYIAVCHRCMVVDNESNPTGEEYPDCRQEEYTLRHFASGILPGQLATVMYRNYKYLENFDHSILCKGLMPWDRLLYFSLISHGKIYCIQEQMSAYRLVRNVGSSFTANYKYDFQTEIMWNSELLKYAQGLNNSEVVKYAEAYFVRNLFGAFKKGCCSFNKLCRELRKVNHKIRAICMWIKSKILRGIFHKEVIY